MENIYYVTFRFNLKLVGCPEAFVWERMLEIAGLVECFPVIGEIPRCSDILVFRWHVV